MPLKNEGYWTKIYPDYTYNTSDEGDGKWIAYLKRNFMGAKDAAKRTVILEVEKFVVVHNLLGAYVTSKNQDIVVVFTSANRFEIEHTKQLIISLLRIKESDMFWKSHYETTEDWRRNEGQLWFLDKLVTGYERKENAFRNGRLQKANAIQRYDLDRTIAHFSLNNMRRKVEIRKTMVIQPSFPTISYCIDPKLVFVAMPLNESWSDDLMVVIKEVGDEFGLTARRADDIFCPGIIVNDIWALINTAGLVIADITVHNANVFYEIGICHTIGKDVVLVRKRGGQDSPFDLSLWRCFDYDLTPILLNEFKNDMRKVFRNYLVTHGIS